MPTPPHGRSLFVRLKTIRRTDTKFVLPDLKLNLALDTAIDHNRHLLWNETIAPIHLDTLTRFDVRNLILYSPTSKQAITGIIHQTGDITQQPPEDYPLIPITQPASSTWIALQRVRTLNTFNPSQYITVPLTRAARPQNLERALRGGHVRSIIVEPQGHNQS